ncbi:hypothetical protein ETN89_15045 [Photobacterium damselae subsp. damselae]|uniref:hypothetical protein n=1 Tax=Photobacterium damselae TaxID=38293 RepID=UPI000A2F996D|nr:hypothetical protein [Photobacterium damselae]ARR51584.1 hypothetical protein CAY62_19535 [Photobacterium damselae subsp. damselae]QAY36637.1 hypothetical protein ETN89_15045 [Photobacterium damselae subsp. damselae]
MGELTHETPVSQNKPNLNPSLSVGGLSTVLIVIANQIVSAHYPSINKELIASVIPILVGVLYWLSQVFCAWFGYGTIAELKTERQLDKRIKFLEKRLKKARTSNRDPQWIAELEKQLLDTEMARVKVS